jgi:pectate lyase
MFSPSLARLLAYSLSIGFLLFGTAWAAAPVEPGREVLGTNDGWASVPTAALPQGTTGGSAAASSRTHTVTNRKELLAALAWPDATPKLIQVKGTIDLNVDDNNAQMTCLNYQQPDPATGEMYTLHGFLAVYDPAGPLARREKEKFDPFGGLENARKASAAAQAGRIRVRVPPNTTIYGVGSDATLLGAWLDIDGTPPKRSANAPGAGATPLNATPMNVIVRNLPFNDTHDCFPEWSPNDGPTGAWNAAYDSITIRGATHVWIDHNRFADVRTRDDIQPVYFGHRYQVHDGLVDITHASDFVTVSWNQFVTHDKTMLIGNSDSATADREHLRVTLHHNLFDSTGQRTPRVRFGRVHVYNNVYRADRNSNFRSAWGAGVESRIVAENNYFEMSRSFNALEVIDGKKGTVMTVRGNCWREGDRCVPTDFLALWNANFDPDLGPDAGWTPSLYGATSGPETVEVAYRRVLDESGPGRISKNKPANNN